jgi:dihydroorotase
MREFDMAPFGISGLETAVSLSLRLVGEGTLTMDQLVEKMTLNPAEILKINKGNLKVGSDADLVIIDTNKEFTVRSDQFFSKGKNTPFEGWMTKGTPVLTVCKGKIYE